MLLKEGALTLDSTTNNAYVLILLKRKVFGLLTILTDSAYVTKCAYLGAYVLMLLKEGALTIDST